MVQSHDLKSRARLRLRLLKSEEPDAEDINSRRPSQKLRSPERENFHGPGSENLGNQDFLATFKVCPATYVQCTLKR